MSHVAGNPGASVTIDEWGDFQCPYCRAFALGPGRQLRESLIPTGQVKFVWHNFAFLGPESVWAAEAAECASDQGQFWEYHDKLFAEQQEENEGAFRKPNLERFAADLGLEAGRFGSCLGSDQHRADVEAERDQGMRDGIHMTPTFFVNGQKYEGVPTWAMLTTWVQKQGAA